MQREIFEVFPRIVDATGAYYILSGYPKSYDSESYNNDIKKARNRARSDAYSIASTFTNGTGDTRQVQCVTITTVNGECIERIVIGELADISQD